MLLSARFFILAALLAPLTTSPIAMQPPKAVGGRVHAAQEHVEACPLQWRCSQGARRAFEGQASAQSQIQALPRHRYNHEYSTLRGGQQPLIHDSVVQNCSDGSTQHTTGANGCVDPLPQHEDNTSLSKGGSAQIPPAAQRVYRDHGCELRGVGKSKSKGSSRHREKGNWYVMYHKLCEYRMIHGSRRMARHHRKKDCSCMDCEAGFGGLGAWVQKQLRLVEAKQVSTNRTQLLQSAGVLGCKSSNDKKAWECRYYELLAFRCRHGHVKVPQNRLVNQVKGRGRSHIRNGNTRQNGVQDQGAAGQVEGEISLGMWVMVQRRKRTIGELETSQIRKLDGVGFVWNRWDDKWEARYHALLLYRQNFGDCNVPKKWKELGSWVPNQRRFVKRGTMPPDRQAKLVDVGLWSNMKAPSRPRNAPGSWTSWAEGQDPNTSSPMQRPEAGDGRCIQRCQTRRDPHEHSAAAVRAGPEGEPNLFFSEGLTWDAAQCRGENVEDILEMMAQGVFDHVIH